MGGPAWTGWWPTLHHLDKAIVNVSGCLCDGRQVDWVAVAERTCSEEFEVGEAGGGRDRREEKVHCVILGVVLIRRVPHNHVDW